MCPAACRRLVRLVRPLYGRIGRRTVERSSEAVTKRSCFPNLDAIKSATADILSGRKKKSITLSWNGDKCSTVEISGLDIGWGQRIPLKYNEEKGLWILQRDLPEGQYEYKYVVDSEWLINHNELVTETNKDGHTNNYIQVSDDNPDITSAILWKRLTDDDPELTENERLIIRQFLDDCPDE